MSKGGRNLRLCHCEYDRRVGEKLKTANKFSVVSGDWKFQSGWRLPFFTQRRVSKTFWIWWEKIIFFFSIIELVFTFPRNKWQISSYRISRASATLQNVHESYAKCIEFPCDNKLFRTKEFGKNFFLQLCAHIFRNGNGGRDRPYDNNLFSHWNAIVHTSHWPEKIDGKNTIRYYLLFVCVHKMQSLEIIFPEEWKTNMNLCTDTHSHAAIMHSSFTQICSDMFNCGVYMRHVWCGVIFTAREKAIASASSFFLLLFFLFIVFPDCEQRREGEWSDCMNCNRKHFMKIPSSHNATHFV